MGQTLTHLRQRMIETSMEFLRVQHAYLEAAAPNARKSASELKEAAEEYRKAIELYDAALQELRQYLLAAEPSEVIATELDHTERLIEVLDKEKEAISKLIEHHMEVIDRDIKRTSRPNPKVDDIPKDS